MLTSLSCPYLVDAFEIEDIFCAMNLDQTVEIHNNAIWAAKV
jgi:hypothetical protein